MFRRGYHAAVAGLASIGLVTIAAAFVARQMPPPAVLFVYATVFVAGVVLDSFIRAVYTYRNHRSKT